jgi:hypothetical protein
MRQSKYTKEQIVASEDMTLKDIADKEQIEMIALYNILKIFVHQNDVSSDSNN